MGISVRTYERWKTDETSLIDKRKGSHQIKPSHVLSEDEKQQIIEICCKDEYSSLPPAQIVPLLADKGTYLASESSFYRVLRENNMTTKRGRVKRRTNQSAPELVAEAANDIWSTDITYLPGPVLGLFFYLYVVIDVFSRKIVGLEVYENESEMHMTHLLKRTITSLKGIMPKVFHSDNGTPMKGRTLLDFIYSLKIIKSYSRPRVKNDNAHIESLFRNLKYFPSYPYQGFSSIDEARKWVSDFVNHYNNHHLHSGISYVTPEQKYTGLDVEILAKRKQVYEQAREKNPRRWSRNRTKSFTPTQVAKVGCKTKRKFDQMANAS